MIRNKFMLMWVTLVFLSACQTSQLITVDENYQSDVVKIVESIDKQIDSINVLTKDLQVPSEGGEVRYYKNKESGIISKIEVDTFGADRNFEIVYYINDEKLIFEKESVNFYDLNELENGGDYKISRSIENQYYYKDGKVYSDSENLQIEGDVDIQDRYDRFSNYYEDTIAITAEKSKFVQDESNFVTVEACKKWSLSLSDVNTILKIVDEVPSVERNAMYYSLPCEIHGKLMKGGGIYSYSINAGATLSISGENSEARYFGCSKEDCEKYFLISPDGMSGL